MRAPRVRRGPVVAAVGLAVAVLTVAGCRSDALPSPPPTAPALQNTAPCRDQPGAQCATLRVPLDHADPAGPTLDLPVRWHRAADPSAPAFLNLDGGPGYGENRAMLMSDLAELPRAAQRSTFVVIETRGTGATAIDCPGLQRAGGGQVLPLPAPAIRSCTHQLGGNRQFYDTAAVVQDLDLLRRAMHLDRWSVMGISYGTLEAERYALAFPDRVDRLVLDSVVPQDGGDPYYSQAFARLPGVLRAYCRAHDCGYDPVADLRDVLAGGADGVGLFDAILSNTDQRPDLGPVLASIHEAALGRPARLAALLRSDAADPHPDPAHLFSVGLYVTTMCTDMRMPWGDAAAPLPGRREAVRAGGARLDPNALAPFTAGTAQDQGQIANCLPFPVTDVTPFAPGAFPQVPALLVQGAWDLITPLPDARHQQRQIPGSRLAVVPRWGHEVIESPAGARLIDDWLTTGSGGASS